MINTIVVFWIKDQLGTHNGIPSLWGLEWLIVVFFGMDTPKSVMRGMQGFGRRIESMRRKEEEKKETVSGVFGVPLEEFHEFGMVPLIVLACIRYLTRTTGSFISSFSLLPCFPFLLKLVLPPCPLLLSERMTTEGLFRVSPSYRELDNLKSLYQTPNDSPDLEQIKVHFPLFLPLFVRALILSFLFTFLFSERSCGLCFVESFFCFSSRAPLSF